MDNLGTENKGVGISVLIPTYKREKILRETLESLACMRNPPVSWEVLCIDNAGDEATRLVAKEFRNSLPLNYIVESRPGKNAALNRGIQSAEGEILVFTDDDVTVDKMWLTELWAGFLRWPQTDVVGGRILPSWPSGNPPFELSSILTKAAFVEADWNLEEGPYSPLQVWGPNMAVRSAVFESGIKFDESVGPNGKDYINGSETSFLLSLSQVGYRPVYLPRALVHHRIRPEQTTEAWLKMRAYRAGRGAARRNPEYSARRIFGVPRYYYRALVEAWAALQWFKVFPVSKGQRVEKMMRLHHCVGRISEFREMSKKN